VREDELGERARIEVILGGRTSDARTITRIEDPSDWRAIFGPRTPEITGLTREGGRARIAIALGGEPAADVTLAVYRDGQRVAEGLPGTTASYLDAATDGATTTHCWAIESCFRGDGETRGTCSQHSRPSCDWGTGNARISVIDASELTAVGGTAITQYGRFHYQGWGDPGHRLESPPFVAPESADYLLQTQYGNGGPIDTGVTCALKRVLVEDVASGEIVGSGVLVMPHLGSWDRWGESSLVRVRLERGRSYRFLIQSDDDTVNMSAFQHFADYTAGVGGRSGAFFRVNIAELRVLRL
jgi:hypothetical protein